MDLSQNAGSPATSLPQPSWDVELDPKDVPFIQTEPTTRCCSLCDPGAALGEMRIIVRHEDVQAASRLGVLKARRRSSRHVGD